MDFVQFYNTWVSVDKVETTRKSIPFRSVFLSSWHSSEGAHRQRRGEREGKQKKTCFWTVLTTHRLISGQFCLRLVSLLTPSKIWFPQNETCWDSLKLLLEILCFCLRKFCRTILCAQLLVTIACGHKSFWNP